MSEDGFQNRLLNLDNVVKRWPSQGCQHGLELQAISYALQEAANRLGLIARIADVVRDQLIQDDYDLDDQIICRINSILSEAKR